MTHETGRTRHYGEFYGLPPEQSPDERAADVSAPIVLVWGNCQAEALRHVLNTLPGNQFRTIRVPPVHELENSDLPHVRRVIARTSILLTQPVRAHYRDLPIGTADVAAHLPRSGRAVRWPVIRDNGLYPFQVIVRHPGDPSAVPPAVPYHDLRTVHAAAVGLSPDRNWNHDVTAAAIREAARLSMESLQFREKRDTDVPISDVLRPARAENAHAINHPGNDVLVALANRLVAACGWEGSATSPNRTLLGSTFTPLDARVVDALNLDCEPRLLWTHDGHDLTADYVHRTQLAWYAEHPEFVGAALERHRELSELLGFGGNQRAAR